MRYLQFILLLTISLFIAAGSTNAQDVVFGDPQNPTWATGINDLEVAGNQYNVTFRAFPKAAEVYGVYPGTLDFNTNTEAEDATIAMISALNNDGATGVTDANAPGQQSILVYIGYESFLLQLGEIKSINCNRGTYFEGNWVNDGYEALTYNGDDKGWALFESTTTAVQTSPIQPEKFGLDQNYPNPFNPTTRIKYQLQESSTVYLSIYNMLGQHIRTLVNSSQAAGSYAAEWDGRNNLGASVPSSVYMYTIIAGDFVQTRKMMLLK